MAPLFSCGIFALNSKTLYYRGSFSRTIISVMFKASFTRNLILLITSLFFLFLVFLFTNPGDRGFVFTLIPIVLFWTISYSFTAIFIRYMFKTRQSTVVSVSSGVASVVSLLGIFSALGDISLIDFILLSSLAVLLNFYLIRTWPK